ncbi:MAG: heme ABC transporter permease [Rhodospirillaceae bacterium]|nr:MAG: heme ABC transporter permease [Rhodospirillaceae bacterium]
MHKYANPTVFMGLANGILPWAGMAMALLFFAGLPMALIVSPADYQQGEAARIMYVHVPAAWMGLMIYGVMAAGSAGFLIWRHPMANLIARASAPLGAMFTAVCLVTGMLWGKPMWGAYWVWDARLTSMLILLFLYVGYLALADAFEDSERGDKAAAVLALVGSVNLPIIHFSVTWWNTLHQPSILTMNGFTVNAAMLWPLFLMVGAFMTYYVCILVLRLRIEILNAKIRNARRARAAEPAVNGATQQA